VQDNWSQIVGPAVACHARPVRLERQILHVAVANPMWGQTLTLERTNLLAKLQQQFRVELKDIRFSSGDWYRRSAGASRRQAEAEQPLARPKWLQHHPSFEPEAIPQSSQPEAENRPGKFSMVGHAQPTTRPSSAPLSGLSVPLP
jgi:hypothetical protein